MNLSRMNAALPAWLYDEIMAGDLADANVVLAKLNARAPLDLRVNTLRGSPAQTRQKLADEGIRARPLAKVPLALRVEGTGQITGGVVFQSGRVEIQDAGAQIAAGCAKLSRARPCWIFAPARAAKPRAGRTNAK